VQGRKAKDAAKPCLIKYLSTKSRIIYTNLKSDYTLLCCIYPFPELVLPDLLTQNLRSYDTVLINLRMFSGPADVSLPGCSMQRITGKTWRTSGMP